MRKKKFKRLLKESLSEAMGDLLRKGGLSIVKADLTKDEDTNLVIRTRPTWNSPIKKA